MKLYSMDEIHKLLNSRFNIIDISIKNFTRMDEVISIEILIDSEICGLKTIVFDEVSDINIDYKYYASSDKSSITIDDVSMLQWQNVSFEIAISEDCMTFHCNTIQLK